MYTNAQVRRNNLLKLLQDSGLKDRELAEKLDVSAGYISQIKQGPDKKGRNIGNNTARKIEKVMGLSFGWMDDPRSINEPRSVYVVNAAKPKSTKNIVPLVTWELAGKTNDPLKICKTTAQSTFIPCPAKHSKYAYALKVSDNHMTASSGKSYPKSAIIYVDPDPEIKLKNGDSIVIKVLGQSRLKFRVLLKDKNTTTLHALNDKVADIHKDFTSYGKVIGTYIPE